MFEELVLEEYLEWDRTHTRAVSHEMEEAILKAIARKQALPAGWKGRRDGIGLGNVIYFERSRCVASDPISREAIITITSICYDFQYKVWESSHTAWPFRLGERLPFKVFSLRRKPDDEQVEGRRRKKFWLGIHQVSLNFPKSLLRGRGARRRKAALSARRRGQ